MQNYHSFSSYILGQNLKGLFHLLHLNSFGAAVALPFWVWIVVPIWLFLGALRAVARDRGPRWLKVVVLSGLALSAALAAFNVATLEWLPKRVPHFKDGYCSLDDQRCQTWWFDIPQLSGRNIHSENSKVQRPGSSLD